MSQYRDDHAAARHRIEALEASLAERDTELARRGEALAEREEEILRLEGELDRAGIARPRRPSAVHGGAMASRVVATSTAIVTAAMGLTAVRLSAQSAAAPPSVFLAPMAAPLTLSPTHPQAAPEQAPIHADPVVQSPVDWMARSPEATAQGAVESPNEAAPAAPGSRPIDFKVWTPDSPDAQLEAYTLRGGPVAPPSEAAIRRSLEAKVRSDRASVDEVKRLLAVCSHMGDRPCREMAQLYLQNRLLRDALMKRDVTTKR